MVRAGRGRRMATRSPSCGWGWRRLGLNYAGRYGGVRASASTAAAA